MNGTHHIGINEDFAKDIALWLVSGEPARTEAIYNRLTHFKQWKETGRKLPFGVGLYTVDRDGEQLKVPVGVATTGMGMSSTEITMTELIGTALAANPEKPVNIIRIGTAGTHQPDKVYGGDLVIADDVYTVFGAVSDLIETRHDDSDYHLELGKALVYERDILRTIESGNGNKTSENLLKQLRCELAKMEIEKVNSCNQDLIDYICEAAGDQENVYLGPVFSKQTLLSECYGAFPFLQPQGKRKIRLEYRSKVMHEMGILASEMEEAMLTSLAGAVLPSYAEVRVGGIMGIVNNPRPGEGSPENPLFADGKTIERAVERAIQLGLETAVQVYKSEKKD